MPIATALAIVVLRGDGQPISMPHVIRSSGRADSASPRGRPASRWRRVVTAAFREWNTEIGRSTGTAHASDFDDVAPDSRRPQGEPRTDWRASRVNDVLRYNRVEGAFTGAAAILRFRDAAPGLAVGASGGGPWSERTVRGAAWSRLLRGPCQFGARAERALANTNSFRPQLDYEQPLLAYLITSLDCGASVAMVVWRGRASRHDSPRAGWRFVFGAGQAF